MKPWHRSSFNSGNGQGGCPLCPAHHCPRPSAPVRIAPLAVEAAGIYIPAVRAVQDALGVGIELVGAVWVLLLSVAAIRAGALPRGLSVLGIAIGVAGSWTLVPQVQEAAAVFGLGFILWHLWAGATLLRG